MFEELGNTVTKAEFRERTETGGRLADAQERTESRVAELAEGQASLTAAQARTEAKVAELTQAQARTEVRLAELSAAQTQTQTELAELTKVVRTLVVNGERQATRQAGAE
jgi:peptidoglycan hydrolase CwlO-like protein